MTRDEAIETLKEMIEWGDPYEVNYDACKIAIEALKQEPCGDAISRQAALKLFATNDGKYLYEAIRDLPSVKPQEPVLDKIRAEIVEDIERYNDIFEYDCNGLRMALDIINKYKAESEEQA